MKLKMVLNKGFVKLVESMGNDLSIVQAARVSYGLGSKGDEFDKKLIKYLLDNNHGTPFEMVQFKFHVKCPIFVMRQWIRHRIGSFNEISGRYSEMKNDFYIPDKWRGQDVKNKQGSSDLLENVDLDFLNVTYASAIEVACIAYNDMLKMGVAKEMARMILPVSLYTEFYWSVNLRSLMNFLELRDHPHAQWEMQQYAKSIKALIESTVPWVYSLKGWDLEQYGIKQLKDGLTLDIIRDEYPWILEAEIKDAILGVTNDYPGIRIKGINLLWYDGIWINGRWGENGIWKSGLMLGVSKK